MLFEHEKEYTSQWAAIKYIVPEIGYTSEAPGPVGPLNLE